MENVSLSLRAKSTERFKVLMKELQDFSLLLLHGMLGVFRKPFYGKDAVEQMEYAGAGSFVIVLLVSLFIGMALSLQLAAELAPLGLKMYTGKIVSISIIREIGPVAIALVFTGRVGSGIASELGSMSLGYQVDMLRTFGIDPVKKLVTPRILGSLVMLPVLTVIGDAVSLFGGYFIAVSVGRQSGGVYWNSVRDVLTFENVFSGIAKPFIFGILIAAVGCYVGLATHGGSRGLRKATTQAVVFSIIIVIIADFILTRILLAVLGAL